MEVKGKIEAINQTVNISATFKKRTFSVEYAENIQYPEYIEFEFIQDKCDILDGYNIGDEVTVNFNLKGRKWTNPQGEIKYFNTLQAWRIVKDAAAADMPEIPAYNQQQPQTTPTYPQGYNQPAAQTPAQPVQPAAQPVMQNTQYQNQAPYPAPNPNHASNDIPF